MGFDASQAHFFSNTCTGAFAFYFTGDGYAVLAFRGTEPNWQDWGTDLNSLKVPWAGSGLVHLGFLNRFDSVWNTDAACGVPEGVNSWLIAHHAVDPKTGKSADGELYVTGHSLGASLATLALAHTQAGTCGEDAECTHAPMYPISALYTYGSPKVGDQNFAYATALHAKNRTPIYRFVNGDDLVTAVPRDLDPIEALVSDYRHIGYPGEPEDGFQVWITGQEMVIASFVFHITWSVSYHLGYVATLLFQAKARNEHH